jgi:hypothetical protein
MTERIVCGHPTPNGPCTRKVIPGAGGCGFHPAPGQQAAIETWNGTQTVDTTSTTSPGAFLPGDAPRYAI